MTKILFFVLACLAPVAASAADSVSLASEILVERTRTDAAGKSAIVREAPKVVTPGDKLVFLLSYRNAGSAPATGFTVTNPVPAAVAFSGADGDGVDLSVDGGKSWGALASLKIAQADGTSRPARPDDITHVRWTFAQPIPAGGTGQLSFRGIVR
jgi:uncharacterized repeat protein (TIGR01451 family)